MNKNKIEIIDLTPERVPVYNSLGCLKSPKHPGFRRKLDWFKKMSGQGLVIKLLLDEGKTAGFIEYAPGEQSWRAVEAKDYNVIHCIWVYPKEYQKKGYGGLLLHECITDSKRQGKKGVAVVTSSGSWIASKNLFLDYGFVEVDKKGRFELMALKFNGAAAPAFIKKVPQNFQGLHLLYSDQCPVAIKFLEDIEVFCEREKIEINIIKLNSAAEARSNPSPFGVFSVIYNNRVVADNPISATRFRNIVRKELKS